VPEYGGGGTQKKKKNSLEEKKKKKGGKKDLRAIESPKRENLLREHKSGKVCQNGKGKKTFVKKKT